MTITKFIKVTLTSLDSESYFDVNEYTYSIDIDINTQNIELMQNGINKAVNEYIPKLTLQRHTCIELSAIQIFDYE